MRGRTVFVILAVLLLSVCIAFASDFYKVTVTRQGANLYRVDGQEIYVKTRFCYEYAYGETAILKYDGYGYSKGSLIFTDSPSSTVECDIEELYEVVVIPRNAVALSTDGEIVEIKALLVPTKL